MDIPTLSWPSTRRLGALIWAENFGGANDYAYGLGIAVDSSSNVYVTGYFSGKATFSGTHNT